MYMNARLAVNMAGLAVVEEDEEEEEEAGGDVEDAFTEASAVDGVSTAFSTAFARACSANRRERIKSKDVPWLLAVTHNFHRRSRECTYGFMTHRRHR
jgi:hypothetical protein